MKEISSFTHVFFKLRDGKVTSNPQPTHRLSRQVKSEVEVVKESSQRTSNKGSIKNPFHTVHNYY